MERSKGIILIVVCLAGILIIWQVGFQKTEQTGSTTTSSEESTSDVSNQPTTNRDSQDPRDRAGRTPTNTNTDPTTTNRIPAPTTEVSNMKISIPEDISNSELQVLYTEYRQISNNVLGMGGGRSQRGGRTDRMRSGRGGMMDVMGGGMMDIMGGGRGAPMDTTGADQTEMMNNMMEMMRGGN